MTPGGQIAAEIAAGLAEASAQTGGGTPLVLSFVRAGQVTTNPADPGNPTIGEPIRFGLGAVRGEWSREEIDGESIQGTDARFDVAATGQQPQIGDVIEGADGDMRVTVVIPVAPGGVPLLYKVGARR